MEERGGTNQVNQRGEIYFAIETNTFCNLNKYKFEAQTERIRAGWKGKGGEEGTNQWNQLKDLIVETTLPTIKE